MPILLAIAIFVVAMACMIAAQAGNVEDDAE